MSRPVVTNELEYRRAQSRDIRELQRRGRGGITRGTAEFRDVLYPPPITTAEVVALANRRVQWFNTERGWMESYYAVTGSAGLTVPGLLAGFPAGWYPVGPAGPYAKLIPNAPQSVVAGTKVTNWSVPGSGGASYIRGGAGWFTYAAASGNLVVRNPGRFQVIGRTLRQAGSGNPALAITVDGIALHQDTGALTASNSGVVLMVANVDIGANQTVYMLNVSGSYQLHMGGNGVAQAAGELAITYLGPPLASE